jgi:hypothetical protein
MLKCFRRPIRIDYRHKSAGFALPLSLSIGMVTILFAAIAIQSAQIEITSAHSQVAIDRATVATETGVARVRAFLNRHRFIADRQLDKWSQAVAGFAKYKSTCPQLDFDRLQQQVKNYSTHQWQNIDDKNPHRGRYKIVSYQYKSGIGILTIAGQTQHANGEIDSEHTLRVTIPISAPDSHIVLPVLWAKSIDLSPSPQINGHLRLYTCADRNQIDPDGIAGVSNDNITKSAGQPSGKLIDDLGTELPQISEPPYNAISLTPITNSIVLPRTGDIADSLGNYHYLVAASSDGSNNSIQLQPSDRIELNLPLTNKVNLYLKGNVSLSGSQTKNVNPAIPNLRIYGNKNTTKMTIADDAVISAIIHAPQADAIVTKGITTASTGITGAVWVNSWNTKTHNATIMLNQSQALLRSDLAIDPKYLPPALAPISSWQPVN